MIIAEQKNALLLLAELRQKIFHESHVAQGDALLISYLHAADRTMTSAHSLRSPKTEVLGPRFVRPRRKIAGLLIPVVGQFQ